MKNLPFRLPKLVCLQLFLMGLGWTTDASAQSVSGRLLDADTNQPIANAAIFLLAADSVLNRTTSNSSGVFQIAAPVEGAYRLKAEHIAYRPATSETLTIGPNERVVVDLRLSVAAIELEAVTVVVTPERRPGELGGFYERQNRSPAGTFITKERIEQLDPTRTSDVLIFHGGLQVSYSRYGDQTFHSGLRQPCMDVIVDRVRLPQGVNVDNFVPPEFIEAIEVYKDAQTIPVPYGRAWSDCGAILIWTNYSR